MKMITQRISGTIIGRRAALALAGLWVPIAAVLSLVILFIGQFVFRRLSVNFAQEL